MKRLLALFVLLAVVVGVGVWFFVRRFDTGQIAEAVSRQIASRTGVTLTPQAVSLGPIAGLVLEDVSVVGGIEAGTIQGTVETIRLRHRLLPLLWGELVIRSIELNGPSVELISRPARQRQADAAPTHLSKKERRERRRAERLEKELSVSGAPPPRPDAQTLGLRLSIERAELRGGEFVARTSDSEEVDLRIADLVLDLRDLKFEPATTVSGERWSGRGTFRCGRVRQGDLEFESAVGSVAAGEGRLELSDVEVRSANGRLRPAEVTVDFNRNPPRYSLRADGELDLDGVVGYSGRDGFGRVDFVIESAAIGPELGALQGDGSTTCEAGSIPPIPSIVETERVLGRSLLTGRRYDRTRVAFRIVDGSVVLQPFELTGEGGAISGSGRVELGWDGELDLSLVLRVSADAFAEEPAAALLGKWIEDHGVLSVPLQVGGTLRNPRLGLRVGASVDSPGGASPTAIDSLLDELRDRATEWLEGQKPDNSDG